MKSVRAISFLLLAAALTACTKNDTMPKSGSMGPERIAGNIMGGVNSSAQFGADNGLVALMLLGEDSEGKPAQAICTGSLIAPTVVLTAAHCVASSFDMRLKMVLVVFSNDIEAVAKEVQAQNFEHVRPVDRLARHGGFGFDEPNKFIMNDISLVRFKGAAPANYKLAKVADASVFAKLQPGVALSYSGYGVTNYILNPVTQEPEGSGSGLLRSIDGRKIVRITADRTKLIFNQTDNKGACHGDSGGPAYYIDAKTGQRLIVGLTSQGYWLDMTKTDVNPLCNQLNVYTNLETYKDWLATKLTEIQQEPAPVATK